MEQLSLNPSAILSTLHGTTSLELQPGVAVALRGENGVGKSTFFHALKTFAVENSKLKNNCSFLDQLPLQPLSHLRGSDYLNAIIEFRPKLTRVQKLADFDLIDHFNFKSHLEKKIQDLSGGENQTLKILGTFLLNSDYYFLDEPTHFLDTSRRVALEKQLNSLLKNNKSLFIIEHDQTFLKTICKKFYKLSRSSEKFVFALDSLE